MTLSKLTFHNVSVFSALEDHKTYFVLMGVNNVPPHIGVISDKLYFSISAKGKKINHNANTILSNLKKIKVPTLIVELKSVIDPDVWRDKLQAKNKLKQDESCFTPLREVLLDLNLIELESRFIYEALNDLMLNDEIVSVDELNLTDQIFEGEYSISAYGQKEINEAILRATILC